MSKSNFVVKEAIHFTGYVIFENITEDQYTLYASADGHSTYSAIILANPDKPTQDIFLQRVAVKYTWTVTPTTIKDVYIITMESTFETFVSLFFIVLIKFVLFQKSYLRGDQFYPELFNPVAPRKAKTP